MMAAQRSRGARGPAADDKVLGARVRARRLALGLSQKDLASALGVTSQQFQKYESGANRISALAMYRLSTLLNLPLDRIFEGVEPGVSAATTDDGAPAVTLGGVQKEKTPLDADLQRDLEALIALTGRMTKNQRAAILDMASNLLR